MLALLLGAAACVISLWSIVLGRRNVRRAYARGYSEAGATLFGVVAAELGHDAPVLDRMLDRYGAGAPRV